jgi:hypothetical protein
MGKMNKINTTLVFLAASTMVHLPSSEAGPISYQGGWMLSTMNKPDSVNWQLSYSPKHWFSIGADYTYDQMSGPQVDPKNYGLIRSNILLKRWNEIDSQGNLYIFGGFGGLRAGQTSSSAWLVGIDADWETRELYTAAKATYMGSEKFDSSTMYQARIGLAPYLTKFENLHTWVILQVQYYSEAPEEKINITPLMRFYIENVLWELGVSAKGTWLFNTMVHF